jgi:hypothetical protein
VLVAEDGLDNQRLRELASAGRCRVRHGW